MIKPKEGLSQDPRSDQALVTATLNGDKGAYRALVERYQGRLFRVAFNVLKNTSDAEDVVQESFVKAFLSLDKFKNQASFYTWLHRITFNMAVDLQRKNRRRGGEHFEYKEDLGVYSTVQESDGNNTAGDAPPLTASIEGPQDALLRRETGKRLDQVFGQLSEEHRAVITLREVDGLDYEEIAQALGVPRGTVMSRLFYARKALQEALRDYAPDSMHQVGRQDDDDESQLDIPTDMSSTKRARG
jgi:RNA polymerase sigma-70 factor (ECF subfamily)